MRGQLGTMTLLPQVVDAVSPLPVVAAGGIGDRRGVAESLVLGTVGVWVGTRFLAAAEANIHPGYRDLPLTASGDDTLYSELFDVGWPNAPLRNAQEQHGEAMAGRRASTSVESTGRGGHHRSARRWLGDSALPLRLAYA